MKIIRTILAACAAAMIMAGAANAAEPGRASVVVHADQPGATISRTIFGQFAEHLGRGIYEGVWVGEDSPIPNTRGYRNDVLEALRKLHVPVVRWPGGCFADEYHWKDGIGPRDQRPVRINTHWGWVDETNAFGTHEFLDFVELIGAEPYIAGNVGSGTPQELAQWVEYITAEGNTTLAQLRRKNGRDKPWKLPYLGIGNETWGCGGNMRPEYFADLFRRFATFVKVPRGQHIVKVASGSNVDDYNWTEVLLSQAGRYMDAYSVHYYTFPGRWEEKGPATGFSKDQWASTLKHALFMDELVTKHSQIMDKYDPQKRIALYVDEWGTWYDPTPGHNPQFLYQQNSIRDALVAAVTLNILQRHADRVRMANIAQMVNVLQAMILTDKDKMVLTPTYHVFEMYVPFQGATLLPTETETAEYHQGEWTLPEVDAFAARGTDGKVHLALVNLDPDRPATVSARIDGTRARAAEGRVLTAPAIDSHNTFDNPNVVQPRPFRGTRRGDALQFELPPRAVAVVTVSP